MIKNTNPSILPRIHNKIAVNRWLDKGAVMIWLIMVIDGYGTLGANCHT